jgi:ABC-type cobalamin/Fe3+-siderophores transport system ATPase subunit
VMLLDEPSMGLDPRSLAGVADLIHELNQGGTTVLLVEQNVRLGLGLATHGVVMEGGKVRLSGTAAEVKDHPEIASLYLGGSAPSSEPSPLSETSPQSPSAEPQPDEPSPSESAGSHHL